MLMWASWCWSVLSRWSLVGGYFVLKRADIPYETLATRYESAASRYVDLPSGVRMHYRDEGAERGRRCC